MKKHLIQKIVLAVGLIAALSFSIIFSVKADTAPDPDAFCSVTFYFDSDVQKLPKQGKVSLYRVADLKPTGGKIAFAYVPAYADCGIETERLESDDIASEIAKYSESRKISSDYNADIISGKAKFVDIRPGLYLVMQSEKIPGYDNFSPFMLSLPLYSEKDGYVYDVVSQPKISPEKDNSSSNSSVTGSRLPQTGQLWWPVIVFAAVGIFLILFSWMVKKLL